MADPQPAAAGDATTEAAASTDAPGKRELAHESEVTAKRPRADEATAATGADGEAEAVASAQPSVDDDFDALMADGDPFADDLDLLASAAPPVVAPEEQGRRAFADRLATARSVEDADVPELITTLSVEAPKWGALRRRRSIALFMVYIARSSRISRAAFIADGLSLLGYVLQDSVTELEKGSAKERQEAGMQIMACLMCLRSLPIGRATLWEHRVAVGKPFDRLHKWCGAEKSALAAELRAPTNLLCKRWKKQQKPAAQEKDPTLKAVRAKVVDVIAQGLLGVTGSSPASPAPLSLASPGMPAPVQAAELEAALFGRHVGEKEDPKEEKEAKTRKLAEYKAHARMLRSNLALTGNSELRARILSGEMDVVDIVKMDSAALAPEALQKEREDIARKSMAEAIIKEPALLPAKDTEGGYSSTAPPPMVDAKKVIAIARRESSSDLLVRSGSLGSIDKTAESTGAAASTAPLPTAPPAVPQKPLEPPPTPFRIGAASPAGGAMRADEDEHVDVLATPAPEDEDEEAASLIRYLSNAV